MHFKRTWIIVRYWTEFRYYNYTVKSKLLLRFFQKSMFLLWRNSILPWKMYLNKATIERRGKCNFYFTYLSEYLSAITYIYDPSIPVYYFAIWSRGKCKIIRHIPYKLSTMHNIYILLQVIAIAFENLWTQIRL